MSIKNTIINHETIFGYLICTLMFSGMIALAAIMSIIIVMFCKGVLKLC